MVNLNLLLAVIDHDIERCKVLPPSFFILPQEIRDRIHAMCLVNTEIVRRPGDDSYRYFYYKDVCAELVGAASTSILLVNSEMRKEHAAVARRHRHFKVTFVFPRKRFGEYPVNSAGERSRPRLPFWLRRLKKTFRDRLSRLVIEVVDRTVNDDPDYRVIGMDGIMCFFPNLRRASLRMLIDLDHKALATIQTFRPAEKYFELPWSSTRKKRPDGTMVSLLDFPEMSNKIEVDCSLYLVSISYRVDRSMARKYILSLIHI